MQKAPKSSFANRLDRVEKARAEVEPSRPLSVPISPTDAEPPREAAPTRRNKSFAVTFATAQAKEKEKLAPATIVPSPVAAKSASTDKPKNPHAVSVLPDWKREVFRKSGLIFALAFGLVAVIAVRVASFHFLGSALVSDTPDQTLAIEAGAALLFSLLLFLVMPFRGLQYSLAQVAGVAAMLFLMHNMVHAAPGLFSTMFSSDWTENVTSETEPRTLYFRGETIQLAPQQKPKLPTIRRVG